MNIIRNCFLLLVVGGFITWRIFLRRAADEVPMIRSEERTKVADGDADISVTYHADRRRLSEWLKDHPMGAITDDEKAEYESLVRQCRKSSKEFNAKYPHLAHEDPETDITDITGEEWKFQ